MFDDLLYEEEMMRLAAELSLQEEREQESYEYAWNPSNLESVRVKLRVYEEILDGIDFTTPEFGDEYTNQIMSNRSSGTGNNWGNNVLSDEELREIFYSAGVSEEEIRMSTNGGIAHTPIKRDRPSQDTVAMICRGLTFYQSKIVDEIQSSHEMVDLTGLLDLRDKIQELLERADAIASGQFSQEATPAGTPALHLPGRSHSHSGYSAAIAHSSSANGNNTNSNLLAPSGGNMSSFLPTVVAAVYAVKRGGNRDEIAAAVTNLTQLCTIGNDVNLTTIKQMASAGALQALLSLLPKTHDWTDIESQIFKIVSMLVSYEEDWALLQRSAMVILTSLYTLQLKSQSRARTRSIPPQPSGGGITVGEDMQQQQSAAEQDRQQGLFIRELVSAAIDKLSLVLSMEWSQQANLIGNLSFLTTSHISGGKNSLNSTMNNSNSNNNSMNNTIGKRPGGTNNANGSGANAVGVGNGNSAGEADAILQILLNLVIFIWESATNGEQSGNIYSTVTGVDITSLKILLLGYNEDSKHSVNTIFHHNTTHNLLPPPLRPLNNSANPSRQQSDDFTNAILTPTPVVAKSPRPPEVLNNGIANSSSPSAITDEFLQRVFQVSLEQLLNGDCPSPERIRHQLIDKSAVLCSAALAKLAEIPQCRPALVARGALKLIKSWVDVCMMMLEVAKRIVFDHLPSVMNHSHFYEAFFKLFSPTYELLSNATEALMYLAGGTHHNSHTSISSSSGGRDYIVGWVDAQILAEELPDIMVKLIAATLECNLYPEPDSIDKSSKTPSSSFRPRTRSVLPLIVTLNVAQTLFQLCSRTQNRQRLRGIAIPYVLCTIFEQAFGYIPEVVGLCVNRRRKSGRKSPMNNNSHECDDEMLCEEEEESSDEDEDEEEDFEDPIFIQIFDFGILTLSAHSEVFQPNAAGNPGSPLSQQQMLQRSGSRVMRHGHHAYTTAPRLSESSLTMIQTQHNPQSYQFNSHLGNRNQSSNNRDSGLNNASNFAMLSLLSSVAAATLDALNNYLADEANQQHYHSNPATSSGVGGVSVTSSLSGYYTVPVDITSLHTGNSTGQKTMLMNTAGQHQQQQQSNIPTNMTLLELIRHSRVVQALLYATSHLGRGAGRLSCVRLISSLTEWSVTLKALYEGSVMDALLVIIYEAEEQELMPTEQSNKSLTPHAPQHNNHQNNNERDDTSFSFFSGSSRAIPKPSTIERNTSGSSSISGMSSSVNSIAFHNTNNMRTTGAHSVDGNYNNMAGFHNNGDDDVNSVVARQSEMLQEETMCVCCALANLCVAEHAYALRMFHSGLVTLMKRLVRNFHFETSRQALRCMHAMAKVVVTEDETAALTASKSPPSNSSSLKNLANAGNATSSNTNNATSNNALLSGSDRHVATKYTELLASIDTILFALASQSVLIQIEAAKTIAQLALINEEFQDRIVDECLRQIVSLLVNPKSDRELKLAAEEVLRNLGFSSGYKDFEICGFDFELLRDWYAIQRSMKPQETSMLILRDWLQRLFPTQDEIANAQHSDERNQPYLRSTGSFSSSNQFGSAALTISSGHSGAGLASPYHSERGGEFHLLQETAAILHTQVDASTSMPAYLLKDHQIVGTGAGGSSGLNSAGSNGSTGHHHHGHGHNQHHHGKSLVSLAIPQLHRHLTDSLQKFQLWAFCSPPQAQKSQSGGFNNHSSNSSAATATADFHTYAEDDNTLAGSRNRSRDSPFQTQQMNRNVNSTGNTPVASGYANSGYNNSSASGTNSGFFSTIQTSQPTVIPASTQSLLNTVAVSFSGLSGGTLGYNNSNNPSSAVSPENVYDWIDKPPAIVVHLLDLFYTSRIHQLILMDLTSLGASIPIHHPQSSEEEENYQFFSFLIPVPHPIKAILLPPRVYTSFNRVGRVLQRMLEYNHQLVSLTFRECYFEGEFHTTLLETLQKCPNVVSLTFANTRAVEEDALLGHLVGQLPSSVRFVSFKGSLSRPSVETLCVMLRGGSNAAFLPCGEHPWDEILHPHAHSQPFGSRVRRPSSRSHDEFHHPSNGPQSTIHSSSGKKKRRSSSEKPEHQQQQHRNNSSKFEMLNTRGLLGIALTHLSLDQNCLNKIVELLNPKANPIKSPFFSPLASYPNPPMLPRRGDSNPSLLSSSNLNSGNTTNNPHPHPSNNPNCNSNSGISGNNTPGSPHMQSSSSGGGGNFVSAFFGASRKSESAIVPPPTVNAGATTPNHHTPAAKRASTPSFRVSHSEAESPASNPASSAMTYMPGLKYMDLSHNDLNDAQCAMVLSAAMKGPLEGLELGGNHIHIGHKLLDVLQDFNPEKMLKHSNRIRYLGLSQNQLAVTTVTKLLAILRPNSSITSLDLSANSLDGTNTALNEALYEFLRHNEGLRVLNLSYNKLNTETYRKIQLGILQNATLLMLPLDGNPRAEIDRSLAIVQEQLKKNRVRYRAWSTHGYAVMSRNLLGLQPNGPQHANYGDGHGFDHDNNEGGDNEDSFSESEEDENRQQPLPSSTREEREARKNTSVSANSAASSALASSTADNNAATAVATAIPVAQVESVLMPTVSAAVVPANQQSTQQQSHNHQHHLTLTLPNNHSNSNLTQHSQQQQQQQHNQQEVPVSSTSVGVHPLSPTSPTVTTTMQLAPLPPQPPLASNNFDANNFASRRRTSSQPPPMSSVAMLSYSVGAKANKTQGKQPNASVSTNTAAAADVDTQGQHPALVNPGGHFTSALSAAPISMVYLPFKQSSGPVVPGGASVDASLSTEQSVVHTAPTAVYRTNTLHVLFSAPLAGYDRQGKAHPMEVLDYASERDALMQVFKETRRDVSLHFDFATTNTLRTILSFGCRALHFSGHGLPNGLCFEDGRSGLQIVGPAQLRDLLGAGGLSLKFVFVSACYSREIGDAFVRAGVSHVVCVKIDSKIQDSAAMAFTRAFYIAFLSGRSVKASFAIAKEALKASPYVPNSVVEGEKFVLLPDDQHISHLSGASTSSASTAAAIALAASDSATTAGSSTSVPTVVSASSATAAAATQAPSKQPQRHEAVIFAGAGLVMDWPQPGMCTIGPNRMDVRVFHHFHSRLPRPPADFEGREVQMNGLVRHLLDRRLVSLVGEDGMGKSAVAAAVCRYMIDRELFKHAIVYVKGKGIKDFHSFLKKLKQELVHSGFIAHTHHHHNHHHHIAPPSQHLQNQHYLQSTAPTVMSVASSMLDPSASTLDSSSAAFAALHAPAGMIMDHGGSTATTTALDLTQPTIITSNSNSSSSSSINTAALTAFSDNMSTNTHVTSGGVGILREPSPAIHAPVTSVASSSVVLEEDIIFAALRETQVLLVFDSLDALLGDYRGAVTDLRLFFHRLFDECSAVKVLNVGVDTLMFHNINMATANALEYCVNLGPLTIASTLRLFARLAPSLITAQEKQQFIASLLPAKQAHCSVQSREANKCTLAILRLFGDGHPARIVHMACESTSESVEKLTRDGLRIRRQYEAPAPPPIPASHQTHHPPHSQLQQSQSQPQQQQQQQQYPPHPHPHPQPSPAPGATNAAAAAAAAASGVSVVHASGHSLITTVPSPMHALQLQPVTNATAGGSNGGGIMADLAAFSIATPASSSNPGTGGVPPSLHNP